MPIIVTASVSPSNGTAPLICGANVNGGSSSWTSTYWDWGDGSSVTPVSYPYTSSHTYSSAGTYPVVFYYTFFGFANSLPVLPAVTVTSAGSANFTFSPSNPTVGQTVTFTNTSVGATSWLWDFGDGNTSTLQNPTHTYSSANTFSVNLTTNGGSFTVTHPVTVTPVASFTFSPSNPTIIQSVNFIDTSLGATSWFWNFGDGNTSTLQNPTHTYSTVNTFTASLSINSGASTTSLPITVSDVAPVSSFTYSPLGGTSPTTIHFTDTSIYGPTSWQWNFGDGNISTLENPSHTYITPGIYTVTLTAGNNTGINSSSQIITINSPTRVEFSDGLMTILPASIINFGNPGSDQTISQTGLLPSNVLSPTGNSEGHIYIMQGTIPSAPNLTSIPFSNVLLDFSVESGSFTIQVNTNPIVISTTYLPSIASGTATWFLWTAYSNIGVLYQQIIGTVGVAGSGADLEISDTSITIGNFYRILNLRLLFGSAWPPLPWVYFTSTPVLPNNAPTVYNFTDNSVHRPTSWLWDFGDGNTSTLQNPSNTYLIQGNYVVTLTATNQYGSGSNSQQIIVNPAVVNPLYAWTGTDGNLNGAIITGASSTANTQLSWSPSGAGNFTYVRSGSPISGKTYCEFSVSTTATQLLPIGFGVQPSPPNLFYNSNGVSMFRGNGGCGLPSSALQDGGNRIAGSQYFFNNNTDIVGIAFDPATGNIWFSINNIWISGNPAAGTNPMATLPAASSFYFTTGMYSCFITSGTYISNIFPNQLTQTYNPPAGFSRYQP